MKILKFVILLFFMSCTTFSPYSKLNKIDGCTGEAYMCIINDSLNLKYKSFGGFKFANNLKEYKKMKVKDEPNFKNIIAYGKSDVLKGDYYLILNNEKYPQNFNYKDTIITGKKITIALNKIIDYKQNRDFLLNFNQNK